MPEREMRERRKTAPLCSAPTSQSRHGSRRPSFKRWLLVGDWEARRRAEHSCDVVEIDRKRKEKGREEGGVHVQFSSVFRSRLIFSLRSRDNSHESEEGDPRASGRIMIGMKEEGDGQAPRGGS